MNVKKLRESQWFGILILALMLVLFWAVFKILAPDTFGSLVASMVVGGEEDIHAHVKELRHHRVGTGELRVTGVG